MSDAHTHSNANFNFAVPDAITFDQAIDLTHSLLAQIEAGSLPDSAIEATLAKLVSSENGARGFFVTYLTDDRPLADQPSPAVVNALKTSAEIVAELLVKNLAMSTAMGLAHRRNHNETMANGSDRVQQRTTQLIQLVQLPQVAEKASQLQQSASTGAGPYQPFLDRWGYDAEQRLAIQQAMERAIHSPT
jgi:hypothetical protein